MCVRLVDQHISLVDDTVEHIQTARPRVVEQAEQASGGALMGSLRCCPSAASGPSPVTCAAITKPTNASIASRPVPSSQDV